MTVENFLFDSYFTPKYYGSRTRRFNTANTNNFHWTRP